MSCLQLTYTPEDDWHGELHASVRSGDFSGHGSAWFQLDQIEEFCARVGDYPLNADNPPVLEGGYWRNEGKELEQRHLSIRVSQHDARGAVRVTVLLATPTSADFEGELHQRVEARFLVNYSDLARFQKSLGSMLGGPLFEASLEAAPT